MKGRGFPVTPQGQAVDLTKTEHEVLGVPMMAAAAPVAGLVFLWLVLLDLLPVSMK